MKIDDRKLYDFLRDSNSIDQDALSLMYNDKNSMEVSLVEKIKESKLIDLVSLQKVRATILGIPFVDLNGLRISFDILQIIPEPIARKHHIIAFERTPSELRVAMNDPEDLQIIDFIRKKTGLRITPCLATLDGIDDILVQYNRSLHAEFGDLIETDAQKMSKKGVSENLEDVAHDLPVVRIVDTLLKHAILQQASDIHIEPEEKDVVVRYRIDGILHDAMTLPKDAMRGIVARIKVLSNLKLDEHRLPQDGRFKIKQVDKSVAFRVSMLPVFDGEKVVMRLLDESSKGLTLEMMGIVGHDLDIIHRNSTRPNGMILVTGPTGSGKTTTLYTLIDTLNQQSVNISTVEDPIEYRMERINQTQVHAKIGMTFAAALRALLRQDPDIIMVGEIRDEETLEVAMHAAMTGHLVLSTLHTNSAAGAIPRMRDMGAETFLIASTLNIVIAQRLVRRLCVECRVEVSVDKDILETLSATIDVKKVFKKLHDVKRIDNETTPQHATLYKAVGCDRCGGTGYKGRSGIFEVLEMTEAIEDATLRGETTDNITRIAIEKNGMLLMMEDGLAKALSGITTIEEILRVTKE